MINVRHILAIVLVTACSQRPPRVAEVDEPEVRHQPVSPPESPARASRASDPDPARIGQVLEDGTGMPVTLLGSVPLTTVGAPFQDLVIFKVSGRDFCKATLPRDRQHECIFSDPPPANNPWALSEFLGVARLSFSEPASLMLLEHRFLDSGPYRFVDYSKYEVAGEKEPKSLTPSTSRLQLDDLRGLDVDGDTHDEVIAVLSEVTVDYDSGYEAVIIDSYRTRLLVFRADTSIQGNILIEKIPDAIHTPSDNARLHSTYSFEASGLALSWCEAPVNSDDFDCADGDCKTPTHGAFLPYDAKLDIYGGPGAEVKQLRPVADEVDCAS